MPMIRVDQRDLVYRTEDAKFNAIVADVVERYEKGQPVLIGTASVEKSEELSRRLRRAGIPHQVLNAKQHAREAAIVALAGRKGAVTVATNMAGRGTDIILGGNPEFLADAVLRERGLDPVEDPEGYEAAWPEVEAEIKEQVAAEHDEVVEAGGLYVIGSERHESRRIDNQLRGRSGRQGDPGESRFYLSLGDDLMRLMKGDMVDWFMRALKVPDDVPIEDKRITKLILQAQEQVEAQHFETRKNVLKYDDVMNRQRYVVYSDRRKVLEGADVSDMLRDTVTKVVTSYVEGATEAFVEDWDFDQLWTTVKTLYPVRLKIADWEERDPKREELVAAFVKDAQAAYDDREEEIGEERMRNLERYVLLTVLDRKWREHLYEMDYLREGIGLRSMASRDPLVEYQREGAGMFATMMDSVMEEVVGFLFHVQVVEQPAPQAPAPVVAAQTKAKGKKSVAKARPGQLKTGPVPGAASVTTPGGGAAAPAPAEADNVPAALKKRSALDAEAAAARSEFHVTAKGLAPTAASTTVPGGRGARPIAKSDTTDLRANKPGQAGRRNKKKKR
jgi:preprotein translocase subunit SecA